MCNSCSVCSAPLLSPVVVTTAGLRRSVCRLVIYLQKDMSDLSPTQRPCPWEKRDIQEAPVEDQVLSPQHRCTCSTHSPTAEGVVREPACSTPSRTAEGAVREPACSTPSRTARGAVREPICSTSSQTTEGAVKEPASSTPSRTAGGAVREPACSTPSRTAEGALRGPYVRLNVGGALFLCSLRVLTSHESRLRDMFSGKTGVMVDSEGCVLVDRCGRHFSLILDFLRDGSVSLPQSRLSIQQIHREAQYYGLTGLELHCQTALQKSLPEPPVCVIPVVTSRKEEEALIRSSSKPVVKLVYNRSNNKYSYTSSSDDNLLKNMELFERLSLNFGSRLRFMKNVIGDDICCWSFYCQGRQISQVCCCSIVCSTDRKHTKVEFPEARLYEETLNTLLFETLPDQHLLEATRRRYHHSCQSEEEDQDWLCSKLALDLL